MTNRLTPALVAIAFAAACPQATTPTVTCAFSPHGRILAETIHQLDNAAASIDLATYSLTSEPIATALIRADKRDVQVRIIVDRGQEASAASVAQKIRKAGIPVRTDKTHALFHHKYIIIDNRITITGSANHSRSAQENNAENIVTITDAATAATFTADFAGHWDHAENFRDRQNDPKPNTPSPTPTPPT